MKKILLLCCLIYATTWCSAQHKKVAATQGIAYDYRLKNDSLFFAKNYNCSQLKVGYHYGKLGVILSTNYIQQVKNTNADDNRKPDNASLANIKRLSNLQTINSMLGLELCLPILPRKLHASVFAGYGINYNWGDSIGYSSNTTPVYLHKVKSTIGGAGQLGISLQYRLTEHLHAKWQNEMNWYKLKFDGIDNRKLLNNYTGQQGKTLFISSIGLQYTF